MTEHPEQHLISIIIDGDLAGVDETNAKQNHDAWQQLSPDGHKELERQRKEVHIQLDQYDILYYMSPDSTRH